VTWIFYDNEEVEEQRNGLRRLAFAHPEQLTADFAILCEPSNAQIEGGCQGNLRAEVRLTGVAVHSARPGWDTTRSTTPVRCCSGWPRTSRSR
jgi:succinyl-diaminopimelate desuccinylase